MTDDDLTTVRVDQFLAHSPAKVWRALTDPELIAQWLIPGDFRLAVGHRYAMHAPALPAPGFSGTISAEVLAFEPEKMLRIGWRDADPEGASGADWTITWTLQAEGRGTRLFLVHEGFDPDHPLQQQARKIMAAGWRWRTMTRLPALRDRVSPLPARNPGPGPAPSGSEQRPKPDVKPKHGPERAPMGQRAATHTAPCPLRPSAICPWTPQHAALQRYKVTHHGTEKKRPAYPRIRS